MLLVLHCIASGTVRKVTPYNTNTCLYKNPVRILNPDRIG